MKPETGGGPRRAAALSLILLACLAASWGRAFAAEVTAPAPEKSVPPMVVSMGYSISVDRLPAASVDLKATVEGTNIDMRATTRTRGLLDVLVGFRSSAESRALLVDGQPVSQSHDAINKWRRKNRHVHLRYAHGLIVSSDVVPSAADDKREVVPETALHDTVDPLTAALTIMTSAAGPKGCAERIPVFDGRRRYDFTCVRVEDDDEAGDAPWRAIYAFRQLYGRQKHPFWPQKKTPRDLTIWFWRADPRLPPVVVRMEARAGLIFFLTQLDELSIDGKPVEVLKGRLRGQSDEADSAKPEN